MKSSVSKLTPTVKLLKGSFKPPKNFIYKDELIRELSEKYLKLLNFKR